MTTQQREFDTYADNLATLDVLKDKIERLEAFDTLTGKQAAELKSLQSAHHVLNEQRKTHERGCLEAGVSFDGQRRLTVESGHTPTRDLDD